MKCCKNKNKDGCCKDLGKKTFFGYSRKVKKVEGGNKK